MYNFFKSMVMWNRKIKLKKEKLVKLGKHSEVTMKIKIQNQKKLHKFNIKTNYLLQTQQVNISRKCTELTQCK